MKLGIQVAWYKIRKRCMQEPYENRNLSSKVIIFFREYVRKPISRILMKLINPFTKSTYADGILGKSSAIQRHYERSGT